MKKIVLSFVIVTGTAVSALAASAINLDSETRSIVVTEGGARNEISIAAGQSVQFCPTGCFVTLPNGDRAALTGTETIEIQGGKARVR